LGSRSHLAACVCCFCNLVLLGSGPICAAAAADDTDEPAEPAVLNLWQLAYSNLGGQGPNEHVPEGMRYSEVTHVKGVAVDMVITSGSEKYTPAKPESNGQHWNPAQAAKGQAFGSLNLKAGTKASIMVHFYKSGTTDHIKVPLFYFSVFDLDNGPGDEQVTIDGFHEMFLTKSSRLQYHITSEGFLFEPAGAPELSPDPMSPSHLSPRQRRHAATFLFKSTSSFPMVLACSESHHGGQWTMIFGSAPINGTYGLLPTQPRAASPSSPRPHPGRKAFNCSSGESSSWHREKAAFCCKHHGEGCDGALVHSAGRIKCFPVFDVEMWTDRKKKWCCKHHEEVRAQVCPDTTTLPGPEHSSTIASKDSPPPTRSSTQPPQTTASSTTELATSSTTNPTTSSVTSSTTSPTTSSAPTTSTSFVPYTGCGKVVSCELRLNNILHNNLGGHGPDTTQPNDMRFANVCMDTSAGGSLDLVVEVEGDYKPTKNSANGLTPERPYGVISVQSGSSVKLRVRFVHSGTDKPAVVKSFLFSFFDLGQSPGSSSQFVTVHSFQTYIVAPDGYVHHMPLVNGVLLTSTTQSIGEDPPVNPLECSADQAKRTAIMLFENVAEFPVLLEVKGVGGSAEDGRDFLFGGRSCLTEQCDHPDSHAGQRVSTTALSTGSGVEDSTAEAKYDCVSELDSWKREWSYEQKAWCCEREEIGCYDCSHPDSVWTSDHREFCCKAHQIGCQSTHQAVAPPAQQSFDCQQSLLLWKSSWSFEKKDWCCRHETLGCYDCSGSDADWLDDQREFCCKTQYVGCTPAATKQQCMGDPSEFVFQKRQWCCETQSVGCFSCDAPNLGWTPPQIDYCCKAKQVGCELSTPPSPPSSQVSAQPTLVKSVAGPQEPVSSFNCQEGLADWELGWSEAKKDWCCAHQSVACSNNFNFQRRFMQRGSKSSESLFSRSGAASSFTLLTGLLMAIAIVTGIVTWSRRVAVVSRSSYTPATELLRDGEGITARSPSHI